jgi:hypothetical protein
MLAPLLNTSNAVAADGSSGQQVRVVVDPRVELMSIIFRLAGNREYNMGCVKQYNEDVEKHFGPFREHAAIKRARDLRQTHSVCFDACMSMAVHVNDPPKLELRMPLEPWPEALDQRWTRQDVPEFLAAARQFAEESKLAEFLAAHEPLYQESAARMKAVLDEHADLGWFDKFFGGKRQVNFTVILGMLNGPGCYGPRMQTPDGPVEMYCILGVWQTDAQGVPQFNRQMIGTVVHEFCHSYANPVVDRFADGVQDAAQRIYAPVKDAMARQAYGNWKTILYESLVRASTVRYILAHEGEAAAQWAILQEKQRSFHWTGELVELLGKYEADRARYPTLDDFAPQLAEFFRVYADRADEQAKAAAARTTAPQPQIVSITPANGATGVDPALAEIRVVFDQPMQDRTWSLVGIGPHFPETTGDPSYDAAGTTWTVPVKLKPGWKYEFMLNSNLLRGFRSREGGALEPVKVTFETKK